MKKRQSSQEDIAHEDEDEDSRTATTKTDPGEKSKENGTVDGGLIDNFFGGWTDSEKNFFILLLLILCYQMYTFSAFHTGKISNTHTAKDLHMLDHGFAPGIPSAAVDVRGLNWVPIYDKAAQVCLNLDALIKSKGDVTPSERELWKVNDCPAHLKGLYEKW